MAYMELSLALAYMLWNYDVRAKSGIRRERERRARAGQGNEKESIKYLITSSATGRDQLINSRLGEHNGWSMPYSVHSQTKILRDPFSFG